MDELGTTPCNICGWPAVEGKVLCEDCTAPPWLPEPVEPYRWGGGE